VAYYSGGMVSEFHQLSEKVSQLADLAASLRRENAELRMNVATLTTENADLAKRIEEAYRRVSALLEKIPASDESEEAA
jgi:cell division protein ZapB